MYNSKIDWCDSTWNPVTGCNHGCKYCYARGIAERFAPFDFPHLTEDGVLKHLNDLNCDENWSKIPVFMKSSLADIWGEPLIQEFPDLLRKIR